MELNTMELNVSVFSSLSLSLSLVFECLDRYSRSDGQTGPESPHGTISSDTVYG